MLEQNHHDWSLRWKREGRKEGRKEGRLEERRRLVERQLGQKFGPLTVATRERLDKADGRQLLRWSERLLNAERLGDVFETREV